MSEEEIAALIDDIYRGLIYLTALPLNLYLFTSNKLLHGLYQGYGATLTELVEKQVDPKVLRNLATNIYRFSAAKTFQNVYDMQSGLYVDGYKVSFADFKKQASQIFDEYNKNWLQTEYNTTIMSATGAAQWEQFDKTKDQFPLLQYQTAHDGRVRPEHAALDNIVKPVNDSFWNSYFPPNGWNCRCDVIQLTEGDVTVLTPEDKKLIKEDVPLIFRNNPGKSGAIFADHHPYFEVEDKYQSLKANNFNLPIPI
jgi:SPP1 gp7 family putative phage head morphogenesis protein